MIALASSRQTMRRLLRHVKSALNRQLGGIASYRARKSGKYWDREVRSQDQDEYVYWLALTQVAQWVNRKVSGEPHIWHLSWFLLSLADKAPVKRALSVGCGAGNLEREVIRHESALHIDGIDVSSRSLENAKALAAQAGYGERISYHRADAESWLKQAARGPGYDLIFFHASLHHVEKLEEVLGLAAASLKGQPGLLYLDEYVGPSRNEWTAADLGYAASLYARIPRHLRRSPELVPPIALDDPTEMIRSSEIPDVLETCYDILEYRPYYGNILMPLVSGIPGRCVGDPAVSHFISKAMELEDFLIRERLIDPMYAVFVARPKTGGPA